jgi:hypothetical protein
MTGLLDHTNVAAIIHALAWVDDEGQAHAIRVAHAVQDRGATTQLVALLHDTLEDGISALDEARTALDEALTKERRRWHYSL